MITCNDCKHYVTAICADCKGFELHSDDNMVYTIKLDSFNTEVKDIERTVESLVKLKDKYKKDNINSPSHYSDRKYETIDVIEDWTKANKLDGVQGYLYGSLIKYLSRFNCKGNAIEDLKKAQWFLNKLLEVRENEKVHG